MHSEPQILLDLFDNKFPVYLDTLNKEYSNFQVQGVVLGISSLHEACFRCKNLMQGFQWKLESVLANLFQENIKISEEFNSLILFEGQKLILHSKEQNSSMINKAEPFLNNTQGKLSDKHKFNFVQN